MKIHKDLDLGSEVNFYMMVLETDPVVCEVIYGQQCNCYSQFKIIAVHIDQNFAIQRAAGYPLHNAKTIVLVIDIVSAS